MNRFVAEFVGSPSMNFLNGEIDLRAHTFRAAGIRFTLNEAQLATFSASGADRRVTFGIRPEHIRVSPNQRDGWLQAALKSVQLN